MDNFSNARRMMVDSQLRAGGVTDRRLLAAFDHVPREDFVPASRRAVAYFDDAHPIGPKGAGRFLVAPAVLARLLQLAEISSGDCVLDVDAGTGYCSAILSRLAASVTAMEPDPDLAASAAASLSRMRADNVRVLCGDARQLPGEKFDVIVLHGLVERPPASLFDYLDKGSRLVALVGTGAMGVATVFHETGLGLEVKTGFNASAPAGSSAAAPVEFVF